MTKLEEKLIELGYVEANFDNNSVYTHYFKNRYGFYDIEIMIDTENKSRIICDDILYPQQITIPLSASKLRICQNELQKDLEVLKEYEKRRITKKVLEEVE